MDNERESAGVNPINPLTEGDLEAKIHEILSQLSTEDIQRLVEEMEAELSSELK